MPNISIRNVECTNKNIKNILFLNNFFSYFTFFLISNIPNEENTIRKNEEIANKCFVRLNYGL